jgi:hypothetical protein
MGSRVQPIGRWLTGRLTDGKKEDGNQEDMPDGKHDGGRSIHDGQWVKCQFYGVLIPARLLFHFQK